MLNISGLNEGIVLDHIQAGRSMDIYFKLGLDRLDCQIAIIKNARSRKMGRKDIIKIEELTDINLDVLGFIDNNITVNIIESGRIVEKKKLTLPEQVRGVIRCKNPRCITAVETDVEHIFRLADRERHLYRCIYCEQEFDR